MSVVTWYGTQLHLQVDGIVDGNVVETISGEIYEGMKIHTSLTVFYVDATGVENYKISVMEPAKILLRQLKEAGMSEFIVVTPSQSIRMLVATLSFATKIKSKVFPSIIKGLAYAKSR